MRACGLLNVLLLAAALWQYNEVCVKVVLACMGLASIPTCFVPRHAAPPDCAAFFERLQTLLVARAPPACCSLHPATGAPTALFQITSLFMGPTAGRVFVIHTPQYIGLAGSGVRKLLAAVRAQKTPAHKNNALSSTLAVIAT